MLRSRILLVEDQPEVAEVLAEMLSETYDVALAGHAADALSQLAARGADLVLLDWGLPGGRASEVLAWAYDAHIPVVVATGDAGIAEDMQAAGSAYLLKPFSFDALMQAVSDGLHHQKAAA